jgi:hypothetical protein
MERLPFYGNLKYAFIPVFALEDWLKFLTPVENSGLI